MLSTVQQISETTRIPACGFIQSDDNPSEIQR